jgi:membrane protein YqaA with SNARE-associated domain
VKKTTIQSVFKEIVIVSFGIGFVLFLLKIGVVGEFLAYLKNFGYWGIFLVGLFFTSVFTASPAALILALMTRSYPIAIVAVLGSLGSMIGDLVIFLFIRKTVVDNTDRILQKTEYKKYLSYTHLGFVRWLGAVVGAFVIISPLPDEIALTIMGIFKIRPIYIVLISFVMNFFVIYGLGLIATNN